MALINIEVAYANPHHQLIINLNINENLSIIDAIIKSKIAKHFPELQDKLTMVTHDENYPHSSDWPNNVSVGIFGKKIDINKYQLKNNDRIEIYRPLAKTPNERRLERVKNA